MKKKTIKVTNIKHIHTHIVPIHNDNGKRTRITTLRLQSYTKNE